MTRRTLTILTFSLFVTYMMVPIVAFAAAKVFEIRERVILQERMKIRPPMRSGSF